MKLKGVIKKIISLPVDFNKIANSKSIYSLLRETGYYEIYNKVTEGVIELELINRTQYIAPWLIWSENKRSSKGWYFFKNENNKFVVAYLGPDEKNESNTEFDHAVEACAQYIKKEIEDIRNS